MSYNLETQIKALIDVPAYYSQYIDRAVNLRDTPKVCCPFHEEDTPSFSYNDMMGVWRCFGSCKTGGDVIAMHQKKHKMHNRKEAMESLAMMFGINTRAIDLTLYDNIKVDEKEIQLADALNRASLKAKTIEDWIELDYLMSFNKTKTELIEDLDEYIVYRSSD